MLHIKFPMARWLALAALLFSHAAGVFAQGSVLAIGGALKDSNDAVWQRFVQLAGGAGARIAVLATASGEPDATAANIIRALARHGAVGEHIRVAPALADGDALAQARQPEWAAKVRAARGVFFSGGAQSRLMDTLQPGGQATPLLQAVRAVWAAGGVVAGTSSGAAVLSAVAFRDAPDPLAVMQGRLREGHEIDRGFGLLPAGLLVDQHFVRRGRIGRLLPLMQARGLPLGIGVEEDSAVLVRGNDVEVIGARGAVFADLSQAAPAASNAAFRLSNARLHWLESGDHFALDTRQVQPAPAKLAGLLLDPAAKGFRAAHSGPAFVADILAEGALPQAMARLVDSDQAALTALSFNAQPSADDPAPRLGFEWRFSKAEGTRGWVIPGSDSATWVGLRLDIVPVRMAQPLYAVQVP